MSNLGRAIEIAATAHAGQFDKGGKPYILHPLWVMNKVRHLGEHYMIVAVLHDVVEDNPNWTIDRLIDEEFDQEVIVALTRLTHIKGVSYEDYIYQIALNPIAKEVKLRDLEHNTKVTRLKGLRTKDYDRIQKYHVAYTYLKNAV